MCQGWCQRSWTAARTSAGLIAQVSLSLDAARHMARRASASAASPVTAWGAPGTSTTARRATAASASRPRRWRATPRQYAA